MRTVFAPLLTLAVFFLSPSHPLTLSPSSAAAAVQQAPGDLIAAGYHLLWSGDQPGGVRHFEALARARPADAPAQFGLLVAQSEQMDVEPALQPAFERGIDALIAQVDARYRRSKQDAEALFYLAQAHLLRAEYRFDHDKGMWGAARDGAKAKGDVDTYLKQHPEHGDAYLVVGAYNYYVDLAPTFFKTLRFLLFLPPRVDGTLSGSTARYRALEGLSSARLSQWRLEDAIAALAPPIDAGVTNPDWVMPNKRPAFAERSLRSRLRPAGREDRPPKLRA